MVTYLKYECALRAEVSPANIETLKRKGWVEVPQPAYDPETQNCDWIDCQWVVSDIVIPVPTQVSMWALREAVMTLGVKGDVETAINSLTEPSKSIAWNRWEYKENIVRESPIITMLQDKLGWTNDFVDDLYKMAYNISSKPN